MKHRKIKKISRKNPTLSRFRTSIYLGLALVFALGITAWLYQPKPSEINLIDNSKTSPKVLVGVRYYAAYNSKGYDGKERRSTNETWISDPKWKAAWPYYSVIRNENTTNLRVDIHQDDQRVTDQEIMLAANAGIDYWAIESGTIDPKYHLENYLKSPNKPFLKFALITPMGALTAQNRWDRHVQETTKLTQDPQYLRLSSGQPLLYIEQFDNFVRTLGEKQAADRLRQLSTQIESATGNKPYLVVLNWGSTNTYAKNNLSNFGISARALYNCRIVDRSAQGAPYSQLSTGCELRWNEHLTRFSDIDYVPTAQVAYDPRSRREAKTGEDADNSIWYQKGSPEEIAAHVGRAIEWTKNNSQKSPAQTVLIAAWSDHSEGGWLVPTLVEGNARLNALAKILGGKQTNTPRSPFLDNPPPPHQQGHISNLSIKEGDILPANQPIKITGKAPAAAKIRVRLGPHKLEFINGDSFNYYKSANLNFTLELPPLPPGGPHTLNFASTDIINKNVKNIYFQ